MCSDLHVFKYASVDPCKGKKSIPSTTVDYWYVEVTGVSKSASTLSVVETVTEIIIKKTKQETYIRLTDNDFNTRFHLQKSSFKLEHNSCLIVYILQAPSTISSDLRA